MFIILVQKKMLKNKGYKNQNNLFYDGYSVSGYSVGDYVEPQSIIIASYPTINLGTGNFLTNIDRSGGDAGQSDYSVYKYTYKNNDGSFTVSWEKQCQDQEQEKKLKKPEA